MNQHKNNIGFLRLILASAVVLGHAAQIQDNNLAREPLMLIFHSLPLGWVAVDGFFLISGYLIAQSMVHSRSLSDYLVRRALRIYPAYIFAYLFSVYLLGPLLGAWPEDTGFRIVIDILYFVPPTHFGVGLPYDFLNAPMWTIAHEFRCYLIVGALGVLGLLLRKRLVFSSTIIGLVLYAGCIDLHFRSRLQMYLTDAFGSFAGDVFHTLRLTTLFFVGVCFFLYRDRLNSLLTTKVAALCGLVALALMFCNSIVAELGIMTFGALALFWAALKMRFGKLQHVNDEWDISYGVYLYGWPIALAIQSTDHSISVWSLAGLSLLASYLFGTISWFGWEKRAKELAKYYSRKKVDAR